MMAAWSLGGWLAAMRCSIVGMGGIVASNGGDAKNLWVDGLASAGGSELFGLGKFID
jgi:hypothetical protein